MLRMMVRLRKYSCSDSPDVKTLGRRWRARRARPRPRLARVVARRTTMQATSPARALGHWARAARLRRELAQHPRGPPRRCPVRARDASRPGASWSAHAPLLRRASCRSPRESDRQTTLRTARPQVDGRIVPFAGTIMQICPTRLGESYGWQDARIYLETCCHGRRAGHGVPSFRSSGPSCVVVEGGPSPGFACA